ncbi:hypothetical protein GCM10009720_06140 [Yaniella flava]|uniref:DUF2267 domain-containing protein n=1 Tax=Yaniella flava TaxID=287930 RepID=A0ABP5FNC5_9MICC|nr:DUF2267 domain-containing protein [Micrococcaceae bacterium]
MQTSEIIELVQERTGNESSTTANDMIIAVLETLAERDLDGAQQNFAAQLPDEFSEVLRHTDQQSQEKFDADAFVQRVAERSDISEDQSETWTRATLSALAESVTTGEREDFISALPNDYVPYARWDV